MALQNSERAPDGPTAELLAATVRHYMPLFEADSRLDAWRLHSALVREIRHEEAALVMSCYWGQGEYSMEMPPDEFVDHVLAFDELFPGLVARVLPGYWLAEALGPRGLMRLAALPHLAYLAAPLDLLRPTAPLPPAYAAAALHRALVCEPDAFGPLRAAHPGAVLLFWDNVDLAPAAERLYGPNLDWGGWQCLWLFALRSGHSALFARLRAIHGDEALAAVVADDRALSVHCLTSPAHPEQLAWVLDHLPAGPALASVAWRLGPVSRPKPLAEHLAKLRARALAREPRPLSCWDGVVRSESVYDFAELAEKLADRRALHLVGRFGGAAEAIAATLDRRPDRAALLAAMAAAFARSASHCDLLLVRDLSALRDYARSAFAPLSFASVFTLHSPRIYDFLNSLCDE